MNCENGNSSQSTHTSKYTCFSARIPTVQQDSILFSSVRLMLVLYNTTFYNIYNEYGSNDIASMCSRNSATVLCVGI